jgi:heptosyltransferase-1
LRVLIVKTSSLGDVVHALPAVTDAARARPGIRFDWVVEEAFAEIPRWHAAVDRVVPVGLRRWRKAPRRTATARSAGAFVRGMRARRYDAVIDAQGLYKSAVMAALARGPVHGLGFGSAREPAAAALYGRRHAVPRDRHAVERVRRLFALALGYAVPAGPPDFGLADAALPPPRVAGPYVVFLHGTVWPTKRWPMDRWRALAQAVGRAGRRAVLPWNAAEDRARAEAIAQGLGHVRAVETPTLSDAAGLIRGAEGVAAVDTGLGHLAAALGVPTATLYGPTSPSLVGTVGPRAAHLVAGLDCVPCRSRQCRIAPEQSDGPPCLAGMDEDRLLAALGFESEAGAGSAGRGAA